jgi:hypothetical protein
MMQSELPPQVLRDPPVDFVDACNKHCAIDLSFVTTAKVWKSLTEELSRSHIRRFLTFSKSGSVGQELREEK